LLYDGPTENHNKIWSSHLTSGMYRCENLKSHIHNLFVKGKILSDRHIRRRLSFRRFYASTVMWPREPVSFSSSFLRFLSLFRAVTHPWWWRQYAPLKRRSTIILHGSITQKTALNIILAAVRTWNLTIYGYLLNRLVDLYEILYWGFVVIGHFDVITFNTIVSTIVKWLRFKSVGCMLYLHHSASLINGLRLLNVGLPWLQQTAFSCCDCGNQGMYFTTGSEIKLNNKLSRMKWNYVRPD
jgi:hypothetical protein